jgi:hypothetical protein
MTGLGISVVLGLLLSMISFAPLNAQAGGAQADANPTAANPAPAGQAPEEVMKRLSDLVHAGKYAEAQQTVAALLILYPDDQRLIKAKMLLDKASVTAGAPSGAPSANPPISNVASPQPASNLAGMDKVDYNALIELARQAQQSTDLEQQKTLLTKFMNQSDPFVRKHPDEMLLWQLRAASAISLNDRTAGNEAGQELLAMGAADSSDLNLNRLLAQLKNQGWLGKEWTERIKKESDFRNKYAWMLGTWGVSYTTTSIYLGGGKRRSISHKIYINEEIKFSKSAPVIEIYSIIDAGVKYDTGPEYRGTLLDSGEIRWEHRQGKDRWDEASASEIDEHKRTVTMVFPSWLNQIDENDPVPLTHLFTKNDSVH